jgi:hypothetical protein
VLAEGPNPPLLDHLEGASTAGAGSRKWSIAPSPTHFTTLPPCRSEAFCTTRVSRARRERDNGSPTYRALVANRKANGAADSVPAKKERRKSRRSVSASASKPRARSTARSRWVGNLRPEVAVL